ncbi:MAG: ferredoxin family protein [Chloroflexi bacterium]|nr:ferredoxin family protein [Chloroflexota bacterium]
MAITKIDPNLCDACGVCFDSCPCDVIRPDSGGKAVISYPDDCQTCYLCEDDCPRRAITVSVEFPYVPVPYKC